MPIRRLLLHAGCAAHADAEAHDDPRDFLPETTAFLEQAATPIVVDEHDTDYLPSSTSSGT